MVFFLLQRVQVFLKKLGREYGLPENVQKYLKEKQIVDEEDLQSLTRGDIQQLQLTAPQKARIYHAAIATRGTASMLYN